MSTLPPDIVDDITKRVERLVQAIYKNTTTPDAEEFRSALSDLIELVLNRSTGMASQTVMLFLERLETLERLAGIEREIGGA